MSIKSTKYTLLLFIVIIPTIIQAQYPVHSRLLYSDSLDDENSTALGTLVSYNASFRAGKGWQATHRSSQLRIELREYLAFEGTIEVQVTNFNPPYQANQDKHHIISFYSRGSGKSSDHESGIFYCPGSWMFIRTGLLYNQDATHGGFKWDVGARGLKTRQDDYRLTDAIWNSNATYTFRVTWDHQKMWLFLDGDLLHTYEFEGQIESFGYIFLGSDNSYRAMIGPIYKNLKIYAPESDVVYTNISRSSGTDANEIYGAQGVAANDVDGDGLDDLLVTYCDTDHSKRALLFRQNTTGVFTDESEIRGLGEIVCGRGALFADMDNDGDNDYFQGNTDAANRLYTNDGTGNFVDANLSALARDTKGVVALDIENDGDLDLFAANGTTPHELYVNNGFGTFTEEARGTNSVVGRDGYAFQAATAADVDNDGDVDIFIARRGDPCVLFINNGNGQFENKATERGVAFQGKANSGTFADIDNDGDQDLFIAVSGGKNVPTPYLKAYENQGSGVFADRTAQINITIDSFGVLFGDVDNDGDLDLYGVYSNYYETVAYSFFVMNEGPWNFTLMNNTGAEISYEDGRGGALLDFNNDGKLDIFAVSRGEQKMYEGFEKESARHYLLKNDTENSNNFLQVAVAVENGIIGGYGAKVSVYEAGHMDESSYLLGYREVTSTVGFLSQNSPIQHFGLGNRTTCDVKVVLPTGQEFVHQNVMANQRLIVGGEVAPAPTQLVEISGNAQSGFVGQQLENSFEVEVRDQLGHPVSGHDVVFEVISGGGTLNGAGTSETTVTTDASGRARAWLTCGETAGTQQVVARGSKNNGTPLDGSPITFEATAVMPPMKMAYVSGNNQIGTVHSTLPEPFEVSVTQLGDPQSGIPVTFSVVSGDGVLNGQQTVTVQTDGAGIARAIATLGGAVGDSTNRFEARCDDCDSGSPVVFVASTTAAAPDTIMTMSGNHQHGIVGRLLPLPFEVKVQDQYGNSVADFLVEFSVLSGGGSFGGQNSIQLTTDAEGKASASLRLGPSAGDNTVRISADGLNGSPIIFTATAEVSVPAILNKISGDGQIGAVMQTLTEPLVVSVTDSFANPIINHEVIFEVVNGGGNLITAQQTQTSVFTDSLGLAQVLLTLGPEPGTANNVVQVISLQNQTPLINSPILFTASAMAPGLQLKYVSGDGQVGVINAPLDSLLMVKVVDEQEKPVPDFIVLFAVTEGGGNIAGYDSFEVATDQDGVAGITATLGSAVGDSNNIFQASAETFGNPVAGSPITFTASARLSKARILEAISDTLLYASAGLPMTSPMTVGVMDIEGNPVAGHPVDFIFENHLLSNNQDSVRVQTDLLGHASMNLSMPKMVGTPLRVLVKSTDGVNALQGSPVTFTIVPVAGPANDSTSTITATSPVLANGHDSSEVTITLRDAFGNPVSQQTVELHTLGDQVSVNQPISPTDSSGQTKGYVTARGAGPAQVWATVNNLVVPADTVEIEFVLMAPTQVTAFGNHQNGEPGDTLQPVGVILLDQDGHPVIDYPVEFVVLEGDGSVAGTQPARSDQNGIAIAIWILGPQPGLNRMEARIEGWPSSPFVFEAEAVASELTIEMVSGDEQSGRPRAQLADPIIVKVKGADGSEMPGHEVTFSVTKGSGQIAESQPIQTDQDGDASVHWILGAAGVQEAEAALEGAVGSPVRFTALAINSAPVLKVTSDTTAVVGQPFFLVPQADDPDEDPITFSGMNLPAGAILDPQSGVFSWQPTTDQIGTHSFALLATDNFAAADTANIVVSVMAQNSAPIIISYSPTDTLLQATFGQVVLFNVDCYDADGDTISYSWYVNDVFWGDQNIFAFIPNETSPNPTTVLLVITDGKTNITLRWHIDVLSKVELSSFEAKAMDDKTVTISWKTNSQPMTIGFNLWRRENDNGEFNKINESLIPVIQSKSYSYSDCGVRAGMRYWYRLEDVGSDGSRASHEPVSVLVPVPKEYALEQNFPNPFSANGRSASGGGSATTIRFQLPRFEQVSIAIFNNSGQIIRKLIDGQLRAGTHTVIWDARDDAGKIVTSGVYHCRMQAGSFIAMRKVVILK